MKKSQPRRSIFINVPSPIIDPAFCNLEIDSVRGESMSLISNDRKNEKEQDYVDRKKIGRKTMDFRLNGYRLEFGVIKAGNGKERTGRMLGNMLQKVNFLFYYYL